MTARSHPRPPVDPTLLNGAGGTMWTNLGFWVSESPSRSSLQARALPYPEAAAALARRVGLAAALKAGDVVVDYACGFGDSLRLWLDEFGVQQVVGIEPDPALCRVIEERARAWGFGERIRIICSAAEDIAPTKAATDVTAIVCVDAAYHFQTRALWLATLGNDVPLGLRLGLADLTVTTGKEDSLRLRGLAQMMHIPRANLMSLRSIALACEDAGFTVESCIQSGAEVLDGFVSRAPRGAMSVAVTRTAIAYARRAQLLDYCVIGARR